MPLSKSDVLRRHAAILGLLLSSLVHVIGERSETPTNCVLWKWMVQSQLAAGSRQPTDGKLLKILLRTSIAAYPPANHPVSQKTLTDRHYKKATHIVCMYIRALIRVQIHRLVT